MTIEPAPALEPFEGTPVYGVAAVIKGLGDGLSKAVRTDPQVFHPGDTATIVVEVTCKEISHVELKDSDGLTRKQVFVGGTLTFVDETLVREVLDAQQVKNDALKGIQQLPLGEVEDDDPEGASPDENPALAAVPDPS